MRIGGQWGSALRTRLGGDEEGLMTDTAEEGGGTHMSGLLAQLEADSSKSGLKA